MISADTFDPKTAHLRGDLLAKYPLKNPAKNESPAPIKNKCIIKDHKIFVKLFYVLADIY